MLCLLLKSLFSRLSLHTFALIIACTLLLEFSPLGYALNSDEIQRPHLKIQLVSEVSKYELGKSFSVALRAQPEAGWHIYWKYPGDSGNTLKADWGASLGASVGEALFPLPKRIPVGSLLNYGYEGETLILFDVVPQNLESGIQLRLDSEWLVCKEECVPADATLSLSIPAAPNNQPAVQSNWSEKIEATRKLLPIDYPSIETMALREGNRLILTGRLPRDKQMGTLTFFPLSSKFIRNAAPQKQRANQDQFELSLTSLEESKEVELSGVLVSSLGWTPYTSTAQGINIQTKITSKTPLISGEAQSGSVSKLLVILLLAFAGGLILNLMPCVFPILTLKLFSLINQKKSRPSDLKWQAFLFSLGVILTFWALAVFIIVARSGGQAIGWGFQLQSPGFVACLSVLTFLVSLNFLGVFEFGSSIQQLASKIDPSAGAKNNKLKFFLEGVLMTTLATPCTAPFMGSALAYGLSASTVELLAVFFALGLGMAFPFVCLTLVPASRALLPKPGAWMETFKNILAFPLFGTTIWLLWVLGLQVGVNLLSVQLSYLLVLGFAAWFYGKFTGPSVKVSKRRIVSSLVILVLGLTFWKSAAINLKSPAKVNWEPFSEARVQELREQGRIVYIDFTAAWCITCQVNKLVALSTSEVAAKMRELNVATLEADWTNRDATISAALAGFGREGVPLNIVYPLSKDSEPELLPQILTPNIVIQAIERAALKP